MKKAENEKYVKLGITGIAVVLVGVVASNLFENGGSIAAFFQTLGGILMPFVYGAVIAYLLSPLCGWFERLLGKGIRNKNGLVTGLSVALSLLTALLVIVLLILLVIPSFVQSVLQIIAALPGQITSFIAWLHNLLEVNPELQETWDESTANLSANVSSWLRTELLPLVQSLIGSLGGQVAGIFTIVKNIFFGILISVYLLASRRKFARQARLLLCGAVPRKWADLIEEEVHYADRMFNGFLMGRILDSVIVGIICFVFTMLCGFDSAVLVSVIIGVTNVIPLFGPFLGAIPCALLLLLENPMHCLIFLVFIVILQQVDGNIIGPRIVGQKTGVSSFWVLFSVMVFGGLWGLVGMIIGVPLFAVLYDILRKLVYLGLQHWKRDDLLKMEPAAKPEPPAAEQAESSRL